VLYSADPTSTGVGAVYELIAHLNEEQAKKMVDKVMYNQAGLDEVVIECKHRYGYIGSLQMAAVCGFRGTSVEKFGDYTIKIVNEIGEGYMTINELIAKGMLSSSKKSGKGDKNMTLSRITSAFAPFVLLMRIKVGVASQFPGLPGPLAFPGVGSITMTKQGVGMYLKFQQAFSSAINGEYKPSIVSNIVRNSKLLADGNFKTSVLTKYPGIFANNEADAHRDITDIPMF
jgi:hypothetical protein